MAGFAAIVASACDLMMLSVVIVPPAELLLSPNLLLGVSALFGTISIPFYAMGYVAIARSLDPIHSRLRRTIESSGLVVGIVGGLIHAITALLIYREQSSGGVWAVEDAVRSGPLLPTLWAIALVASVVATIAVILALFTGRGSFPRVVAILNPIAVTVLIVGAVLGGGSEEMAEFVVPAAPNLAHIIFFLVGAASAGKAMQRVAT